MTENVCCLTVFPQDYQPRVPKSHSWLMQHPGTIMDTGTLHLVAYTAGPRASSTSLTSLPLSPDGPMVVSPKAN